MNPIATSNANGNAYAVGNPNVTRPVDVNPPSRPIDTRPVDDNSGKGKKLDIKA